MPLPSNQLDNTQRTFMQEQHMGKLETMLAGFTPAQRKQFAAIIAATQATPATPATPAPAVTTVEAVVVCYPTLAAVRALGYAAPMDATMAVLSKKGRVHYYAVAANGSRESYTEYHQPTARECATLRSTASTTR